MEGSPWSALKISRNGARGAGFPAGVKTLDRTGSEAENADDEVDDSKGGFGTRRGPLSPSRVTGVGATSLTPKAARGVVNAVFLFSPGVTAGCEFSSLKGTNFKKISMGC